MIFVSHSHTACTLASMSSQMKILHPNMQRDLYVKSFLTFRSAGLADKRQNALFSVLISKAQRLTTCTPLEACQTPVTRKTRAALRLPN